MSNGITVCLADDHKLFREGLRSTLESDGRYKVVHEVGDAASLKTELQIRSVDLVLLDYRMPGGGSLAALEYIKKRFPTTKVILLTGMDVSPIFQQFVDLKADGVLIKEISSEELLGSVAKVVSGERVVAAEVRNYLDSKKAQLSAREYQVMELILEGLSNTEMADRLGISIKTVGNHRHNLMQKLNLKNTVELMRFAIKNGYLEGE